MTTSNPKGIKKRTVVILIVVYTFLTSLNDFKDGFAAGWNAARTQQIK